MFFRCPFSISDLSGHFDPQYPFNDITLHLALPIFFLDLTPPAFAMEMDPSKESSPRTILLALDTSPFVVGDQAVPEFWPFEDDTLTSMLKNVFHNPHPLRTSVYLCLDDCGIYLY